MSLRAKRNRFDVQISESLVRGIHNERLTFEGHELGGEPSTEHLAVEGLPGLEMIIIVGVLKVYDGGVRLDLTNVKEHFVDFFVGVGVRTTKVVTLSNGLLHFETVGRCERHICHIDRLHLVLHALNLPIHSVEHLHLHAPLCRNRRILLQKIHHIGWPQNGNIRADGFHFLLADPLSAQTLALRVRIGTRGRNVNKAFNLGRVFDCFRNSHRHTNVRLLKVFLVAEEHARSNARNRHIGVRKCMLNLFCIRHVLQLDVTLVSEVSCSFGLLESVVPDSCSLSVWESTGGADAGQHASNVVSEGGGRAENGRAESTH